MGPFTKVEPTEDESRQQSLYGGSTKNGWLYVREDGVAVFPLTLFSRISSIQFYPIPLVPM